MKHLVFCQTEKFKNKIRISGKMDWNFVPSKVFLTKGVGRHRDYLQSFELALRDAGIAQCNLVNVSSILPPKCKFVPKEKGIQELHPGQITFVVMSLLGVYLFSYDNFQIFIKLNILILILATIISAILAIVTWQKRWYDAMGFFFKKPKKQ